MDDFGWGATESVDGGYVITGETFSFGNGQSDIYIFKIDSVGNKVWSNTFGGLSEDVGYSIVNSDDGGYVVASQTRSYGKGGNDGMIVKFDSLGTKEWNKVYGGKGLDYFKSITNDPLNGYVIAGGTRSFNNGDSQGWVMNVDENGYLIPQQTNTIGFFKATYKRNLDTLTKRMSQTDEYAAMFKYLFPVDRMLGINTIYSREKLILTQLNLVRNFTKTNIKATAKQAKISL